MGTRLIIIRRRKPQRVYADNTNKKHFDLNIIYGFYFPSESANDKKKKNKDTSICIELIEKMDNKRSTLTMYYTVLSSSPIKNISYAF